jgi:hypothetical protein
LNATLTPLLCHARSARLGRSAMKVGETHTKTNRHKKVSHTRKIHARKATHTHRDNRGDNGGGTPSRSWARQVCENASSLVHAGARWCTLVHAGARWCTLVHAGARWCTLMRRPRGSRVRADAHAGSIVLAEAFLGVPHLVAGVGVHAGDDDATRRDGQRGRDADDVLLAASVAVAVVAVVVPATQTIATAIVAIFKQQQRCLVAVTCITTIRLRVSECEHACKCTWAPGSLRACVYV